MLCASCGGCCCLRHGGRIPRKGTLAPGQGNAQGAEGQVLKKRLRRSAVHWRPRDEEACHMAARYLGFIGNDLCQCDRGGVSTTRRLPRYITPLAST